ncbi:chemokine XC receptor 1-like [Carassius auratus]|uniref:Chemokine XC receptor 1-like n=1 Tax=Carassius auratus TaxID=7957 RepID=A0A6P6J1M4_CARAU|nr:chemokine XC receptor 1-like [Carassius auratus]
MSNPMVNFTTPEASTNSTTQSIGILDGLNICVYSIGFLFGLPSQSYIIWLIITRTANGVATELFILNLSACEIGICLNYFLYALSYLFLHLSTLKLFFLGLSITGRPLFQCLICVERYLAVVHPVTFLKYKPLRYRVICCAAAWIIIIGSCFWCLFTTVSNNIACIWILSMQFLIFFSIQLFCLVAVLIALKQSGPGERARERGEENHMKRRAFYLILVTTVSMAIIYGPYIIIGFLTIVINEFLHPLWLIAFICYIVAGLVNPVLYLHRTGKLSCLRLP